MQQAILTLFDLHLKAMLQIRLRVAVYVLSFMRTFSCGAYIAQWPMLQLFINAAILSLP